MQFTYGTAQFKLDTRTLLTRVHFTSALSEARQNVHLARERICTPIQLTGEACTYKSFSSAYYNTLEKMHAHIAGEA